MKVSVKKKCMMAAYRIAYCRLAMNLYIYYENACEDESISRRVLSYEPEMIRLIRQFREGICDLAGLDILRNQVIEDMEALTLSIDRFQIYEYILNRMEYRFREVPEEAKKSPKEVCEELMGLLHAAQDASESNLLLADIQAQLPIRMTKQKFYDVLTDRVVTINGITDVILENLLERLSSSAMLEKPVSIPQWSEMQELMYKLDGYQWKSLTEEQFEEAEGCLKLGTERIHTEMDSIMLLQNILNALYVLFLTAEELENKPAEQDVYENIGSRILYGLEHDDEAMNYEALDDLMMGLEGVQEECADIWGSADPEDEDPKIGKLYKLLSSSSFMSLEADPEETILDKKQIRDRLISFCEKMDEHLKTLQKPVVRAVMSSLLAQVPGVFRDLEEVQETILDSLTACSDEAEKAGCIAALCMVGEDPDPESDLW